MNCYWLNHAIMINCLLFVIVQSGQLTDLVSCATQPVTDFRYAKKCCMHLDKILSINFINIYSNFTNINNNFIMIKKVKFKIYKIIFQNCTRIFYINLIMVSILMSSKKNFFLVRFPYITYCAT